MTRTTSAPPSPSPSNRERRIVLQYALEVVEGWMREQHHKDAVLGILSREIAELKGIAHESP